MYYKYSLLFIFSFFSLQTFAQTSDNAAEVEIRGIIIDGETDERLPFTTVSVTRVADGSLAGGGITDAEGVFKIKINPGNYNITIQSIAHASFTIENVKASAGNSQMNLGEIKLETDVKKLSEVVIEGQKSQMELGLDKRVFNISKDLSNMGGTAADIMNNIPSVQVDLEGNVSLRGSDNVQILVDGKPSGLVGMNGNALRQLQGSIIERIEVVTNPSSRYDAEGSGGIINIVLKKDKEKGINGSFDVTLGYPAFHGASANVNFRRKNANFFVNYGFNYQNTPGRGAATQEFFLQDSSFSTDRRTERLRGRISNNFRTGMDYNINDKNTITAAFLYRHSAGDNRGTVNYIDFDGDKNLINRTLRTDLEAEARSNLEYEFNYKRTFDQKGRILTADVQYRQSNDLEENDFLEVYSNDAPDLIQEAVNDENNTNLLTQVDYIHPFSEKGKVEVGYRGNFRRIGNDYIVEELDSEGERRILENLTNNFVYDENVYAFYFMVGNKINSISYQIGLRSETTDLKTDLRTTNEVATKSYTNLFPSAYFTFDLNKDNSIQVSYSRRLRRPRFRELNPFSSFTDARNIRIGNPDLDPSYTDSYEVGYVKNFNSGNFYAGSYYRYTTGVVQRVSIVNEEGITFSQPANLGLSNSYGVEVNASLDLMDWWKVNGNFNFFRNITEGSFSDQRIDFDTYGWWTRFMSRMTIAKTYETQVSVFYRSPQDIAQGRSLSMSSVDIGITRDILGKNGTIGVSVRDLFNSRKWRSITEGPNFVSNSEFQWRARQFLLNFTYRLNQKKNRRPSRSNDGEMGDDDF